MKTAVNNYVELQVASNFSLLRGASHPHEFFEQAQKLGYTALAITDWYTLSGLVKSEIAAQEQAVRLISGARLSFNYVHPKNCKQSITVSFLLYPISVLGYQNLATLISKTKHNTDELLNLTELINYQKDLLISFAPVPELNGTQLGLLICAIKDLQSALNDKNFLSLVLTRYQDHYDQERIKTVVELASKTQVPLVATNDVYYHCPTRKALQDVLTCVREHTTIEKAGCLLFANSQRYLKSAEQMHKLLADWPMALKRTLEIAEMTASFSIKQVSYDFPDTLTPPGVKSIDYLTELTLQGAKERYPLGVNQQIQELIESELKLIAELKYEKYFLTCYDIVRFARGAGILCQGRGAAANSAVCFCLGITAVDPAQINLLFARFISKERNEPPDIDIDFEHERREEVIQYIYQRYGKQHAALVCSVITYQARSAFKDVGKALGLTLDQLDSLARSLHHWTGSKLTRADLVLHNLNPDDPLLVNTIKLARQLKNFPRHLSQHVGGFIISDRPLSSIAPVVPTPMPGRYMLEWDKDDIEYLQLLKIDVLALGMLTCIRRALDLINQHCLDKDQDKFELHNIPTEDPEVYEMLCAADSLGVFQVESRAQMSMLPRLKPRCFYDLVIQVAIVRPGPIHGDMVHPFLRRRNGLETVTYPDPEVEIILGKTLGVPIFQEQAMRLAIVLAGFSGGEAEQLRRAMAAWKRNTGKIEIFQQRIIAAMLARGYAEKFALTCVNQLKGFSEYGFPESHAASFAHLVYVSAWIKKHYPAAFAAALINSQPMGFYAPAQIVADARAHGVEVLALDVNHSEWNCSLPGENTLRLGLCLVRSLGQIQAELIKNYIADQPLKSIAGLWQRMQPNLLIQKGSLQALARADAFGSLGLNSRTALWEIHALDQKSKQLDRYFNYGDKKPGLPETSLQLEMFNDYRSTGLSLKAHPFDFMRADLNSADVLCARQLPELAASNTVHFVKVAGLVLFRQRPQTSKGVIFLTLEDETGVFNVVIMPPVFERHQREILHAKALQVYGRVEQLKGPVYVRGDRFQGIQISETRSNKPLLT